MNGYGKLNVPIMLSLSWGQIDSKGIFRDYNESLKYWTQTQQNIYSDFIVDDCFLSTLCFPQKI